MPSLGFRSIICLISPSLETAQVSFTPSKTMRVRDWASQPFCAFDVECRASYAGCVDCLKALCTGLSDRNDLHFLWKEGIWEDNYSDSGKCFYFPALSGACGDNKRGRGQRAGLDSGLAPSIEDD